MAAKLASHTGGSGPVILACPVCAVGLSMISEPAAQVLHESRVNAPWAKQPPARRLLQRLAAEHSFYCAPHGSNDDWYWMYAAVRAGAHGRAASLSFDTSGLGSRSGCVFGFPKPMARMTTCTECTRLCALVRGGAHHMLS